MNKDDHYERTLFGRLKAALRVNHEDGSITARLTDPEGISVLRATVCRSHNTALGASFRLDEGADSDMVMAGLYLGRARAYVGARSPAMRTVMQALGIGRSLTSCEVYRYDDGAVCGPETTLRAHLLDRDDGAFNGRRDLYVNLTGALFGRWDGEDAVLEDREVDVCLPEATYRTRSRLIERTVSRPRWPLKRYVRFVEFVDAAMIVPQRKSDSFQHYGYNGSATVAGQSIEQGIGELVGRVLRDRKVYGGKAWADGPPPREKWLDSHKVSLASLPATTGYTGHALAIEQDLHHGDSIGGPALGFTVERDKLAGGLMLTQRGMQAIIDRGTRSLADFTREPQRLYPGDKVRVGDLAFTVHFAPIGPVVAPATAWPVSDVSVASISAAAKAHGFIRTVPVFGDIVNKGASRVGWRDEALTRDHNRPYVNHGPALARGIGRQPLKGLTYRDMQAARLDDFEWYKANADIVSGAREGLVFDGNAWREPVGSTVAEEFGAVERDVAEAVAELQNDPPAVSPSEEAEGEAAREYLLGDLPDSDPVEVDGFAPAHFDGKRWVVDAPE